MICCLTILINLRFNDLLFTIYLRFSYLTIYSPPPLEGLGEAAIIIYDLTIYYLLFIYDLVI